MAKAAKQPATTRQRGKTAGLPAVPEATLRDVIEQLAPYDRTPCSQGERLAALQLARRWRELGIERIELEDEPSWGPFPPTLVGLGLVGVLGGLLTWRGSRRMGPALTLASTAGTIDEAQNGPRVVRRLVRRRRQTVNVVARLGDPAATRKLVLLAHHDAPQTGIIFDQTGLKKLHARFPDLVEQRKTSPPQWWIGLAGPALAALGLVTKRRAFTALGTAIGAFGTGLLADIMRSPTVPGANDNLSGVAVLTAVGEMLQAEPLPGLQVWLVSCGAEETLQDGIRAFTARHRSELDEGDTWVLNLDTVGSPHLGMLEGEGPFWMEDYSGPQFRDLIELCAEEHGITFERGMRARSSTDSVITSRAGWPSTCLVSTTDWRGLANYHLLTDVPENIDYDTVADATRLAYAVAGALARGDS